MRADVEWISLSDTFLPWASEPRTGSTAVVTNDFVAGRLWCLLNP